MRIYYDTEFLEGGPLRPISLISIGMVREDGEEYYAVNRNAPWDDIYADEWLRENVLPHLPRDREHTEEWRPDYMHAAVKSPRHIAREVANFCYTEFWQTREALHLWAYYADYDHVVLSQLFGRMTDLPTHMPMYTRDFKQLNDMLRPGSGLPQQDGDEHHALADARWLRDQFVALERALIGSKVGKLIEL